VAGSNIKRLFGDSFLYSMGAVLSRFLTFWLLPLTTSYLTPADYGIIGTLALLSNLLVGLYQIGFNTSIGPVFFSDKQESEKVISGAFLTLVLNGIFWTLIFGLNAESIGFWLLWKPGFGDLVFLTLLTTAFTACQSPFIFYLRARQKARLVVALSLIDIVISNALMIFFVMFLERGPRGVIEAQTISLGASLALSALCILPFISFGYPLKKIKS